MKKRIQALIAKLSSIFITIPEQLQSEFEIDCLRKNVLRLSILPYFNIFIQFSCLFIYLYIYPSIYPGRLTLDEPLYFLFTAVYILLNLLALFVFHKLNKKMYTEKQIRFARIAVNLFLMIYILMEASQVATELGISGNIYRFLGTFCVVSFLLLFNRIKKFFYMALYMAISEFALFYLSHTLEIPMFKFPEIVFVFFIVSVIASNLFYSNDIKNYILHDDLIKTNQKLQSLNKKLELLSVTDALTGVANRRALDDYMKLCWSTARRNDAYLNMIMIDIDYFKNFNDTYGHQAGDDCLIQVSACIKQFFNRVSDMVARYGGEEFAVLLPYTDPNNCLDLARKVKSAVENLKIPHQSGLPVGVVTISVGVASKKPEIGERYETLVKMADEALYNAKNLGRNRVESSSLKR